MGRRRAAEVRDALRTGLEFWIEGQTLQFNVQVGPATSTIPTNATQSESTLQIEINAAEPNKTVAQAAYNDTLLAYPGGLGLGATGIAKNLSVG